MSTQEQSQQQPEEPSYTPPDEKAIALDPIGPPAPPPEPKATVS